jgi:hypothetical protein
MIFAEIESDKDVPARHSELAHALHGQFSNLRFGLQSDSWFLIIGTSGDVMVDTLTSMRHQIKSPEAGEHVQAVISALRQSFSVLVYDAPKAEMHEDE